MKPRVEGVVAILAQAVSLGRGMQADPDAVLQAKAKFAIVAILIVAAIITPTTDMFTLFVVALPIYLLYELSIQIVRITKQNRTNTLC